MRHIEELKNKLLEAGLTEELHSKFIEFEQKYHGEKDRFGLNSVCWGILFEDIKSQSSALISGEVVAEEEDGIWHVACADVHASDTMTIDQYGKLYWSYQARYSDFNLYFAGKSPDIVEE